MTVKIPEGWREASLGNLIQEKLYKIKNNLRQPLSSSQRVKMQGCYPYYGAAGQIDSVDNYKFEGHHLLVAEDGTVTKDGIHPMLQLVDGKFWVSNHAHVLQGNTKKDTLLLYYMLYNVNISKYITGAVQPKLSKRNLLNIKILSPPLPEQKAIASLLEKWDTATEKTEALIAAKQKQFKWLVKTLIEQKQYINGWQKVKLGEVGNFSKGNGITKSELVENGVPCIRYGELYTRHDIKVKEFYSFIENKNLDKYTWIKKNSLLFAGSGETREEIGKCASFNHNIEVYAGGDVIILSIDPANLNAEFASFYLNTKGRKQINRLGQGNSIVHIYSRFLQNIKIPCPPISEQNAIVRTLNTAQREIILLEQLAERYQVQKRGLMNKLLTGEWRISV